MNDNGQRLLELCTYHDLRIANSYFRTKPQHKVSWRHPCSKHWYQLDLILFISGVPVSHALTTVRITTQTTPWCVARSGSNQRCSIALRNRGTPVLMSARCHNQTSCHHLRRLFTEIRCHTAQRLCHREVGNSPRHHAPHSPWLPSGKYLKDSRLV